jgi:hypothetical protein
MGDNYFLEIDSAQIFKKGQLVGGDVFLSQRSGDENRTVSVLSDGLGSGVKANVLATLTTTLAARCIDGRVSPRRTAQVIMQSLPECSIRKISYATFTIVEIGGDRSVKIVEFDNPPYLLIRDGELVRPERTSVSIESSIHSRNTLFSSRFKLMNGDRIIIFSDGVTQSGMGNASFPLGWEQGKVEEWVLSLIRRNKNISARNLAREIVNRGVRNDIFTAKDDITSAVFYMREPRKLLIATGPPIDRKQDSELALRIRDFKGRVVISGGTTANIVSRELNRAVDTKLSSLDSDLPPSAAMEGIEIVTEGIFTLSRVAEILEDENLDEIRKENSATAVVELLRDSDEIQFLVGTRINEAHQDPNIPVGLEIRRNIVRRIADILSASLLKEVNITYI